MTADSAMFAQDPDEFTKEDLDLLLANIDKLTDAEVAEVLEIAGVLEQREYARTCQDDLLAFILHMEPGYLVGAHHRVLITMLMDIAEGKKDRIAVNIAPRHGKSHIVSTYFPAWFIGKYPNKKVMMVSHTADLAVDFGRKVRNIVSSERYHEIFPGVSLSADSKSAGRWNTNAGGEYYATGVGSSLAGRGADLLLCLSGDTTIQTDTGVKQAKDVRAGDRILGYRGFHPVAKVFTSVHETQVVVDGVKMSRDHPVWTFNRGWVVASALTTHDVLDTLSLLQHVGVQYEKFKNNAWQVLHTRLQHMGHDATEVHKSQSSKLFKLWRAGNNLLRRVATVFPVLQGHGGTAVDQTHSRPGGQQQWVLPGKLSMGGCGNSAEQPDKCQQHSSVWADPECCAVGSENGVEQRHDNPSNFRDGDALRGCFEGRENELGSAPCRVSEFGWLKRAGFRLISYCGKSGWGSTRVVVGCVEKVFSSDIFGLLMGVRRPRSVVEEDIGCGSSKQFYNFHVPDFNTIYAGSWMTHNCDDPHSEQDILAGNFAVFETAFNWFTFGARTRLMPGGRIAIVQTRWHTADLTGRLVKQMTMNPDADQYEVVEFPAILNENTPEEKALWPEFFDLAALKRTRENMPAFQWNAQYQQNPTGETSAIIKRDWWGVWEADEPPECEYLIMTLDAAAELNNRADFTAIQVWGIFFNDSTSRHEIILLNAVTERVEFPELKVLAKRLYDEWKPDTFIVEKKSSGVALYQELRRTGMSINEYTPVRGTLNSPNNKFARLQSVADMIKDKLVWAPQVRWADAVVEEVAAFPFGEHDDNVDCMIMALMRFRSGGFVRLSTDEPEDPQWFKGHRRGAYY